MIIIICLMFAVAIFFFVKFVQQIQGNKAISERIVKEKKERRPTLYHVFRGLIRIISKLNKMIPSRYEEKLQKQISYAKITSQYTVDEILALKELLLITVVLVYLLLFDNIDIIGVSLAVMSFFMPNLWLKERKEAYVKDISKNLPYALDLITVCIESGLTFDSAVSKFVAKSKDSFLKSEFIEFLKDMRLGKSRKDALKDMSLRVNVPEFSSFVSAVIQSVQFGTSMAGTLRIQASQVRTKRIQRIERLAMEAPVKLLIPLIIFIFPVIFIMLFGPITIKLLGMF